MRWVRVNRRFGAWAALFALTLQLVLSFGHVHLEKLAVSSAANGSLLQTASRDHSPSLPGNHTGANDFCAICATIGLIATAVPPAPAHFALPVAEPSAWPRQSEIALAGSEWHFPFQARAPPFIG